MLVFGCQLKRHDNIAQSNGFGGIALKLTNELVFQAAWRLFNQHTFEIHDQNRVIFKAYFVCIKNKPTDAYRIQNKTKDQRHAKAIDHPVGHFENAPID